MVPKPRRSITNPACAGSLHESSEVHNDAFLSTPGNLVPLFCIRSNATYIFPHKHAALNFSTTFAHPLQSHARAAMHYKQTRDCALHALHLCASWSSTASWWAYHEFFALWIDEPFLRISSFARCWPVRASHRIVPLRASNGGVYMQICVMCLRHMWHCVAFSRLIRARRNAALRFIVRTQGSVTRPSVTGSN